jgi:hypothetical protein
MLCTTPGLDDMTVELLVEEWREMLYDAWRRKILHLPGLVNINKKRWKDPPFLI